ncbi:mitochondrial exonuclease V [Scheffersomyces amazonensis]|uniref:mitochondrial exonuclease V n=1 Tax=Scheffersomyces amazonensis TaxID=1078765 RepID=UPI00315C6AD9
MTIIPTNKGYWTVARRVYSNVSKHTISKPELSSTFGIHQDRVISNDELTTEESPIELKPNMKISSHSNEDIRSLLKSFILPHNHICQADDTTDLENNALQKLYFNWKLPSSSSLPLHSNISIDPYEFFATNNDENSYIANPRLSVTRLLTTSWCELRDYYTVYAGSPLTQVTQQMKLGSQHHIRLETEKHAVIETETVAQVLKNHYNLNKDLIYDLIEQIEDEETISIYEQKLEEFNAFMTGNVEEGKIVKEWSDQIINRLFVLFITGEAREILVHGFLNLRERRFLSNRQDLRYNELVNSRINENKVLVSGIIDHVELYNPSDSSDLSLFDKINDCITENPDDNIDLTNFIEKIVPILEDNKSKYEIKVSDVKTRSQNYIPYHESVLLAAKYQTFYYRKMLGLLSNEDQNDPEFAYFSLLENLRARNLDPDKPINFITLVEILRKYKQLLYSDFVKLSRGESIGFSPFDEYVQENQYNESYNPGSIIQNEEVEMEVDMEGNDFLSYKKLDIDELNNADKEFDFHKVLTPELLRNWKIPPTLRYFAARGSQFYHLLQNHLGSKTSIEYHNGKTGKVIQIKKHEYDEEILSQQIAYTSTFWDGERLPSPTKNLDKCKYCMFSSKCLIPNSGFTEYENKKLLGSTISHFLHSDYAN